MSWTIPLLAMLATIGIGVFFIVLELALKAWRDRRSDPYVTLSDRRVRLKALKEKD